MSEELVFPVPEQIAANAWVDKNKYKEMYKASIENPETFWKEQGARIDWMKPYKSIKDVDFKNDAKIKWFYDGSLNASYNCLDRHLETRSDQTAIIWESDDPEVSKSITYKELHKEVCQLSNSLKNEGIKKGDVVTIYMPMIPEAAAAMLACARIGAIHSVVFGGFSPEALAGRIND